MGLCPSAPAFNSPSSAGTSSSTSSRSPIVRFAVVNVDEFGNDGPKGHIEVYPEGILLRRRHLADVFWPLRSLRRYGCNDDLFTFESGRQSETGEGTFAFRLKRPKKLFAAVKQAIEAESYAMMESNLRAQQTGLSPGDVHLDSATATPNSLLTVGTVPTNHIAPVSQSEPGVAPSYPSNEPFPTHHEIIGGTLTNPSYEVKAANRGSRPPPLNLQQQSMYINQGPPKAQVPARCDYIEVEATPINSRSPQSTNAPISIKSMSASVHSSTTDSSTHYTQVDHSKTDAIRTASTAAPSSNPPGMAHQGFNIPSVNGTRGSPAAINRLK